MNGPAGAGHGMEENMIRTKRVTLLAGMVAATTAISGVSSVFAQDAVLGVPAVPTGYTELDQALAADMPMQNATVTMQTQWITAEGDDFSAALEPFRTATGIDVRVAEVPSGQHEQLVWSTFPSTAASRLTSSRSPNRALSTPTATRA